MNYTYYCLKQDNDYVTKIYHYPSKGSTVASILLFHGMAEHHTRYEYFINYMTDLGFSIYTFDQRGHGLDKRIDELGHIHKKNGYKKVISDALNIIEYVKSHTSSERLFLMGHSMGSLILRNTLQYNDDADGAIFFGTTCPGWLETQTALVLSSCVSIIKGSSHPSVFLNNILFSGKVYTRYCNRTAFDWLTRDNRIISQYIQDPYCGFICSASFYHDLVKLTELANTPKLMMKSRKDLPLYIVSGDQDPVSNNGKEVQKLYDLYTSFHFSNVTMKLYPDCRHELLNELNKDTIISELSAWINDQIPIS